METPTQITKETFKSKRNFIYHKLECKNNRLQVTIKLPFSILSLSQHHQQQQQASKDEKK